MAVPGRIGLSTFSGTGRTGRAGRTGIVVE